MDITISNITSVLNKALHQEPLIEEELQLLVSIISEPFVLGDMTEENKSIISNISHEDYQDTLVNVIINSIIFSYKMRKGIE